MDTTIKSFSVYGLFGANDVHIKFDSNVKILVGENGIGKTQVLNLFYYTLTKNFSKLIEFSFDKLVIKFADESILSLPKASLDIQLERIIADPVLKEIIIKIGIKEFIRFRDEFLEHGNLKRSKISRNIADKFYLDFIEYNFKNSTEIKHTSHKKRLLKNNINSLPIIRECTEIIKSNTAHLEIMYFPTFRRVEEDLHILGKKEDDFLDNKENLLIQFGMDDVKRRFEKIENKIDKFIKEGLAEFTKDILNVVISDSNPSDVEILEQIDENDIEIILSRVGDSLPDAQKEAVKNIVAKKQFKNPLSRYLLQKLVDIYEKQKTHDNSIKRFRNVCNSYLINKKVFYDESKIKIFVKSDLTDSEIELSKLSSGEKQIISIFSKIYLSEEDKRFMVLFDEPELSLSMMWQKQLLPDIMASGKCDFLLAVTHSPFIFDNELDKYAVGLNEYFAPMNQTPQAIH